jgi:serine/threonine-protein kinase
LPFEGEAVGDLLVKLCTAPIPVPSQLVQDVPPGFDAWLAKALSREPAERFSSAAQLGESLAAVCGIPVRGAYVSSEMARMSELGSGPYGAVSAASAPAFGPGLAVNVAPIALATGAPTTRTPSPMKRKPTGAIVAATAAAFVVFAIGGAVALKKFSAPSSAPVTATPPAPFATTLASLPAVAVPATPASATAAAAAAANSAQNTVETATAAVAKNPPKAAARAPAKPAAPAKPSPKPASARKESDIGF